MKDSPFYSAVSVDDDGHCRATFLLFSCLELVMYTDLESSLPCASVSRFCVRNKKS
jgi:hypothetical protein